MPPLICDAAVTRPAGRTPPSGADKKGTAGAVPFLYGTASSIAALTQPELDGGHVPRAGALLTGAPLEHPPVKGIDRLCLADIVAVAGQHVGSVGAESVIQHIHAHVLGTGGTRPLRHEGVRASGAEYVRDLLANGMTKEQICDYFRDKTNALFDTYIADKRPTASV